MRRHTVNKPLIYKSGFSYHIQHLLDHKFVTACAQEYVLPAIYFTLNVTLTLNIALAFTWWLQYLLSRLTFSKQHACVAYDKKFNI